MRRLVVVGAGAIGGGLGGLLAAAGLDVALVQRGEHGRVIRETGLRVASVLGVHVWFPECVDSLDVDGLSADDHVLVATRLPDARAVYRALEGTAATVVVGQNGVHGIQWAEESCPRVVATMVWVPSEHLEPGHVRIYGDPVPGRVDVGPGGEALRDALRAAGFQSDVRDPILPWVHAKWLTNLAGLAFRAGVPERATDLMEEGRAVLDAAGVPHVLDELLAEVGGIRLCRIDGRERVAGGSSVHGRLRDRPAEQPWLNGELLRIARRAGVPTPVHDALADGLPPSAGLAG
ncbi:MAG: hypothetical protein H6736_23815 [Alphaproteobacteria bacterium]|nr:hypothetical protein [Alphaproteobacteria bacterium]